MSASICEPFSPALRILKIKETYLASLVTKILIVQDGNKTKQIKQVIPIDCGEDNSGKIQGALATQNLENLTNLGGVGYTGKKLELEE